MPDTRPTFPGSLSRLNARLRARGPAEVLSLALARLRNGISSADTLVLFVQASGGDFETIPDLEFSRATSADAVAYARDIGTDSAATFRLRLSERTRCYLVRDTSGLVVHSSWVTTATAWTREIRAYLRPPDGDAYVYESFTRPEVRGRGVYPFVLRAIRATAASDGVGRVWVAVEAGNAASLRSVTKAGFEEAFRIGFRRRLGTLRVDPPTGPRAHEGVGFVTRNP